jgi:adenosylcobinamide-GDP ribazoletransferase
VNNIYLGIKFALSYFTILPIRFKADDDLSHPKVLAAMLYALPIVGVILAGLTIGLFCALESLHWLGALIAAVAYMGMYGFIHTEAVIDVADAVYAAHSGKDPYQVIKEPSVGAMGVLYGVSFLLLKIASLSFLLMFHLFLPFIAIAMTSRIALLILIKHHNFRSSFVSQLHNSLYVLPLMLFIGVYGAVGFYTLSWPFLSLFFIGIGTSILLCAFAKKSLGFINGDVLGMALEGVELILILAVLLAWN